MVSRSWPATLARPAVGTSSPERIDEQRRLAGAGRADDRQQLALLDREREALQGLHLDALGGEDPHQVSAFDLCGHSSPILRAPAGAKRRPRALASRPGEHDDDDERRRRRRRSTADRSPGRVACCRRRTRAGRARRSPGRAATARAPCRRGRPSPRRARAPTPRARGSAAPLIPRMRSTPTMRLRAAAAATEASTTVSRVSSSEPMAVTTSAERRPPTVGAALHLREPRRGVEHVRRIAEDLRLGGDHDLLDRRDARRAIRGRGPAGCGSAPRPRCRSRSASDSSISTQCRLIPGTRIGRDDAGRCGEARSDHQVGAGDA